MELLHGPLLKTSSRISAGVTSLLSKAHGRSHVAFGALRSLSAAPATGPLRVHPDNSRYFADGSQGPGGSFKASSIMASTPTALLLDEHTQNVLVKHNLCTPKSSRQGTNGITGKPMCVDADAVHSGAGEWGGASALRIRLAYYRRGSGGTIPDLWALPRSKR